MVGLLKVSRLPFETMFEKKAELLQMKAPLVDYGDDHLPGKLIDDGQPCKCEKTNRKPGNHPITTASLFQLMNKVY